MVIVGFPVDFAGIARGRAGTYPIFAGQTGGAQPPGIGRGRGRQRLTALKRSTGCA
jgi:hypothetical protein